MESQVNASGASGMDGGAGDAQGESSVVSITNTEPLPTSTEKVVKYNDHKKALDDMHRFKKEATEARAEAERVRQAQLQEKEDYKTLWEREKKLREEKESEINQFKTNYVENEKWAAVEREFRKAGVREEMLKVLRNQPLDGIETEYTSQGRVLVHGADTLVESWKKDFPFAFQAPKVPQFNSGGAGTTTLVNGKVTAADVFKAEQEAKKSPEKRQAYHDTLKRFMEQK